MSYFLIRGVLIFYPDQVGGVVPVLYPYTIALTQNNPAVLDVELLNSFNGISAVGAARHYIARVQGQPTNIGIFVDQTYGIVSCMRGRTLLLLSSLCRHWPH
jgi:hypothetical protein